MKRSLAAGATSALLDDDGLDLRLGMKWPASTGTSLLDPMLDRHVDEETLGLALTLNRPVIVPPGEGEVRRRTHEADQAR